jgi:hypothetical protein
VRHDLPYVKSSNLRILFLIIVNNIEDSIVMQNSGVLYKEKLHFESRP